MYIDMLTCIPFSGKLLINCKWFAFCLLVYWLIGENGNYDRKENQSILSAYPQSKEVLESKERYNKKIQI